MSDSIDTEIRDSVIGMPVELLFEREHDNLVTRALWTAVRAIHIRTVRDPHGRTTRALAP